MAAVVAVLPGLAVIASAQEIPALTDLPASVAAANPDLVSRRALLAQERVTLHGRIDNLNAQCAAVKEGSTAEASCKRDQVALLSALDSHIQQSKDFDAAAHAAIQTPIVPNLANDPNAALLSAGQLRLVDSRIANLQRAIALLGDSNSEWARERRHVLEDMHEDTINASMEGVDLLTLGLAQCAKVVAQSNLSGMRMNVLWAAFQEPLAKLPSEEKRLKRILETTQNPNLAGAILEYLAHLHRLRDARKSAEVVNIIARTRDAADALLSQFKLMKLKPPPYDDADGLYMSSAFLGGVAIIFVAEGPEAFIATLGSAGSSIGVGGRELVNLWEEHGQLKALDQNTSGRNRMRVQLTTRLDDLQHQRDRLVWSAQHAGSADEFR
jgi:hypothetical protein